MKKLSELNIANCLIATGPLAGTPVFSATYDYSIKDTERRDWVRREVQRYGNKLLSLQLKEAVGEQYDKIVKQALSNHLIQREEALRFQPIVAISNELKNFFNCFKIPN